MKFSTRRIIAFTVVVAFMLATVFSHVYALDGNQADAAGSIAAAKAELLDCFLEEQKAEAEGADVAWLLAILNDAAGYLNSAELAYKSNDTNAAFNLAVECQNRLANFDSQVATANQAAAEETRMNFLVLLFSITGAATVLAAGVMAYVNLDRRSKRS